MGISSISTKYLTPAWGGVKSASKAYANIVFGTQNEAFSEALKKSAKQDGWKNFGKNLKDAYNSTKPTEGFWASTWKSLKSFFPDMKSGVKEASGFFGKTKSIFKTIGKKMPLIGNILLVAFEAPNLIKSFTEGGVATGAVETVKVAGKLGGFAAGAAIGQALMPFFPVGGAIIGGIVGGWLADKLLGKSYTEKQEEKLAEQQKLQPGTQNPAGQPNAQNVINPQGQNTQAQLAALGINPFGTDFYGQSNANYNPSSLSQDYMNRDFMAASVGLA